MSVKSLTVVGVIPAAGQSSRASGYKLFYKWNDKLVIDSVADSMSVVCSGIIVVTGARREELDRHFSSRDKVITVYNPKWRLGMVSSVRAGLKAAGKENILYCPADYPAIKANTFLRICRFGLKKDKIIRASYRHKAGPPLFLPAESWEDFLNAGPELSLRSWLNARDCLFLDCGDPYILEDVDTDDDYERIRARTDI